MLELQGTLTIYQLNETHLQKRFLNYWALVTPSPMLIDMFDCPSFSLKILLCCQTRGQTDKFKQQLIEPF
jgi:hypothetical protein